jgi:hypothetical protein
MTADMTETLLRGIQAQLATIAQRMGDVQEDQKTMREQVELS